MRRPAQAMFGGWRLIRFSISRVNSHAATSHPRHNCALIAPSPAGLSRANASRVIRKRSFFTDALPAMLVPPALFTGLLLTLWTYKCAMTVLFQDKIIYMPYMPPFARSEKIDDYVTICKPVGWEQRFIRSSDGTRLSICIGRLQSETSSELTRSREKEVVVCYFHGNGSSIPPRLPLLSGVLKAINLQASKTGSHPTRYTLIALSYRGYWTSSGRASQSGIERDAEALLQWISTEYAKPSPHTDLVLWGQSIGAGVASTAAAAWLLKAEPGKLPITCMVLETPFTSIKGMLLALYPQKWLPYRYLWPFLWNHWDTELALRRIAAAGSLPQVLLLPATRDEVVPVEEANKIESLCRELRLPAVRNDVVGALHTNATVRQEGQNMVAKFIVGATKGKDSRVPM